MAAASLAGKPRDPRARSSVIARPAGGSIALKPAAAAGMWNAPMPAKKTTRAKTPETSLRHVWLAGLGVLAVARREALAAANDAAARIEAAREQASRFASDAQSNVLHGLASVREQGETRVGQFSAEVEARLAPVLAKLGLKPAKPAPARKAPAKPRSRKPAAKAPAKRTRTAARKPAAKRATGRSRA